MPQGAQNTAMTEIALALAMAFFSIMVLTMVSMGAGQILDDTKPEAEINAERITLKPSQAPAAHPAAAAVAPASLILYYRGRFFDAALKPIDPAAFTGREAVLALAPDLSMTEALAVRKRVPAEQLTVTTLDERWLARLKETHR